MSFSIHCGITPSLPSDDQPAIGIIGMGCMGKMYARRLSEAGWKKINVCDLPENHEKLCLEMKDIPGVRVFKSGHLVSRESDFIMYSVEAEFIARVVAEYGPSTKVGAVVAGQTSVKAPERDAFDKYLPKDVHIISCHSLHGPTVSTVGQPLAIIHHRGPAWAVHFVEDILRPFKSRYVYLSYEDHDLVTANTQAVTHAAFLSMGTAWRNASEYPWEDAGLYVSGIEVVKVNITLRIYANKWHVYAGLAILNPSARVQIDQFSKSTTELFKLMLSGDADALRKRVYQSRDKVFCEHEGGAVTPILLSEDLLDRFSLGKNANASKSKPNSHLSLLAMVDCWSALGIDPLAHLELAGTPIFRMWIGVAEYLFRSPSRLNAAIDAAIRDVLHRSDDLEFTLAARGWSQCISFGSFELYERRFTETAKFFEPRFAEAADVGAEMIKAISQSTTK
ncbi:Prephenate dehydrogenase [Hysterangium stoloniferum]|nr:Prephenate dehydrogenase [Hysterangium stoloniferum]